MNKCPRCGWKPFNGQKCVHCGYVPVPIPPEDDRYKERVEQDDIWRLYEECRRRGEPMDYD